MPAYFTVDRNGSLSEGLTIELSRFNDIDPDFLQRHVDEMLPDGVSRHGDSYFLNSSQPAVVASPNIELLWEYVRRAVRPNAPSRFQSMFVWENKVDAEYFASTYGGGAIWEIEAEGGFRADMTWLTLQGSLLQVSYNAKSYWGQQELGASTGSGTEPRWEVLLPLPVTVGRRI